jgi:hypothetical protein
MEVEKMRIVTLLTRWENAEKLIRRTAHYAERLEAGVTLLYVREEHLFELPLFERRMPSREEVQAKLRELARKVGGEEWVVFCHDDDPVDRAILEATREHATLLISDERKESEALLRRAPSPLIFPALDKASGTCARGLLVFDPAFRGEQCLPEIRRILAAREWSAYMDYQVIPAVGEVTGIDPLADAVVTDLELEEELREIREKAFKAFCEAQGLEGYFEVGEAGVVEDILQRAAVVEAECLACIVADRETLLADALPELVRKATGDLMVCFQD